MVLDLDESKVQVQRQGRMDDGEQTRIDNGSNRSSRDAVMGSMTASGDPLIHSKYSDGILCGCVALFTSDRKGTGSGA